MNNKMHIGIDPGSTGAIVVIMPDGEIMKFPSPHNPKSGVDDHAYAKVFRFLKALEGDKHVVLEHVHSLFGMSAKSNFMFGHSLGWLKGQLDAHQFSYTMIAPKLWQKETNIGLLDKDAKVRSLKAAKRLFPDVDLRKNDRCRKEDSGIVDALLMAEYSRRNFD